MITRYCAALLAGTLAFSPIASAEAARDDERPPPQDDERPPLQDEREDREVACDLSSPVPNLERCSTPRDGVLSGFYFAVDLGFMRMDSEAEARVGVSSGPAAQLRLGLEFFDYLIVAGSFGGFMPADERPFTEWVVDCVGEVCEDSPYESDSTVSALNLGAEVGAQQRFRPSQRVSLSPGLMLGVVGTLSGLQRSVECRGCTAMELDADPGGLYAAPFLRLTFGRIGQYAAIIRSQWFLTGDVMHMSSLGIECGLP